MERSWAARLLDARVSEPESETCDVCGVDSPPYAPDVLLVLLGRCDDIVLLPIDPDRITATTSLREVVEPEKEVARPSNAEGAAPGGRPFSCDE